MRCLAQVVLALAAASALAGKPHIILVVQDDLGWADTGAMLGRSWPAAAYTKNITSLAEQGVRLNRAYAHWHCSPTRRSILTGRLPIHHGEQLSGVQTDDIDLRMTLLPDKMKQAGYRSYSMGKGHTGYKSMRHLWTNNGFDSYVGYLEGSQYYYSNDRWQDLHPLHDNAQFVDPPPGCGNSTVVGAGAATCDPSTIRHNTELPCSDGSPKFMDVATAEDCCAACGDDSWCTHWVFARGQGKPPCHLKAGSVPPSCIKPSQGATSGVTRQPSPAPSPAPLGPDSCAAEYGTDLYGSVAVQNIMGHDASTPLFMYLAFQDQHTPYNAPPWSPPSVRNDTYKAMMWAGDTQLGRVVEALKVRGMWEDTLLFYVSDNGGVSEGLNYPKRGEKHSNWEGGMAVAAFVSGGALPSALRGTESDVVTHVVDLYATIASLAGVDPSDGPAVPPRPVDPSRPGMNIYGNDSYPAVDGVDIWPLITAPGAANATSAHEYLTLSREVLVNGRYKLLVSQPLFKTQNNGWKQPNGTWIEANDKDWPCTAQDLAPQRSFLPGVPGHTPCLFDVVADPGEHVNLAVQHPDVVQDLWSRLNASVLTLRDCSGWSGPVPGPDGSCSPAALLGHCDEACANDYWYAHYGGSSHDQGPICGLAACNATRAE